MSKAFKCLAFLLLIAVKNFAQDAYQPSETKLFDLIHTDLVLKPNWGNNHLEGQAKLTLKPWFYPQDQLILDAKGFDVHEVKIKDKEARFIYDQLKLTIDLDRKYTRNDTLQVAIKYTAKPDEFGQINELKNLSYKGLYFVNKDNQKPQQIWTEGETRYNSCWFPTLDSPNQKQTQQIAITVPKNFVTLSNGLKINSIENTDGSKTEIWKQDLPHAVYLTMIAAGEFSKVVDSTFKDFEVAYYVEPKFEKSAYAIFGRTPEMIRFFEDLLKVKYPWAKYAQIPVRDYVSGAMENTTATVHGSGIQKVANQLVDSNDDAVIAHELFHHWFGDLVTTESWANLPLNESFANYSEFLWANFKYGKDEAAWANFSALNEYLSEAEEKQLPTIRYHYGSEEEMFDNHSYAKGGRILHMLRQEVGDEAFFASLNLYLNTFKFENAEINDLREAFESVTGKDLNWFFNQWFLKAGHPRLQVSHSYKKGNLEVHFSQTVDSSNNLIYEFPIQIEIGTKDKNYIQIVRVNQATQSFSIPVDEKPLFVSIDPNSDFLGQVDHEQSEKELFAAAKLSGGMITRLKAFQEVTQGSDSEDSDLALNVMFDKPKRELALSLLNDKAWRVREAATFKFFDYDGDDFLNVEKALQSLVRSDEKSQVRSAAILAMKNFLNPQNDLLFRKALADTAYSVRAAALEALLINKPDDAEDLVNKMVDIDDVNIFSAVANYKAEKGSVADYDWFISKISQQSGIDLYQTLGIFGGYLLALPEEYQLKTIPFLSHIAEKESVWVGRMAATQALLLLIDHKEAIDALKKVIANEKEEHLIELYRQLPIN